MSKHRRILAFVMALLILLGSGPLEVLAIQSNSSKTKGLAVTEKIQPVTLPKADSQEVADSQVKDSDLEEEYTVRINYSLKEDESLTLAQPYIATVKKSELDDIVGSGIRIQSPRFTGYIPEDYQYYVDITQEDFKNNRTFEVKYMTGTINVKVDHRLQGLMRDDFSRIHKRTESMQRVGSYYNVEPIEIPGYVSERHVGSIIPQTNEEFILELRYYRDTFNAHYITGEGASQERTKRLYFGQPIPKVDDPTRHMYDFKGWTPRESADPNSPIVSLHDRDPETPVVDPSQKPAKRDIPPDAEGFMPDQDVYFHANWEVKSQDPVNYYVQLWAQNADDDGYAYVGGWQNQGQIGGDVDLVSSATRADHLNLPSHPSVTNPIASEELANITLPDLKPEDIQAADGTVDYEKLRYYYYINGDKTAQENNEKTISANGDTAINIYMDRREYKLYFGKDPSTSFTFNPTIEDPGGEIEGLVKEEGYDKLYSLTARFGEFLGDKWPYEKHIQGWPRNRGNAGWYLAGVGYRDTPPYRLENELFIKYLINRGPGNHPSSVSLTENGARKNLQLGDYDIYLGIRSTTTTHPIHRVIYLETLPGQEEKYTRKEQNGKTYEIDYYFLASDTSRAAYQFPAPRVRGFEPVQDKKRQITFRGEDRADQYLNVTTPQGKPVYENNPDGTRASSNGLLEFFFNRNSYRVNFRNQDEDILKTIELPYAIEIEKAKIYKDTIGKDQFSKEEMAKHKPSYYPPYYEFKGWALDRAGSVPVAGSNLKLPDYDISLYPMWGPPDKTLDVVFDFGEGKGQGGSDEVKIKTWLGDAVQVYYGNEALKRSDHQNNWVIDVYSTFEDGWEGKPNGGNIPHEDGYLQGERMTRPDGKDVVRYKLNLPKLQGHDFMDWEFLVKEDDGSYTAAPPGTIPFAYAFGNEVVEDVKLKAMWVPNDRVSATITRTFFDNAGKEIPEKYEEETISDLRAGAYQAVTAKGFRGFIPRERYKITRIERGEDIDGQRDVDINKFDFEYDQLRDHDIDIYYKDEAGNEIIPATKNADSPNRDYDVVDYTKIDGYKLVGSKVRTIRISDGKTINERDAGANPQVQLKARVEDGERIGHRYEVDFIYKDVRVLDRTKDIDEYTPEGYHRLTFSTDGNGILKLNGNKLADEKDNTLIYDVYDGIKFGNIITPDQEANTGHRFKGWQEPFLGRYEPIKGDHSFMAMYDGKVRRVMDTENLGPIPAGYERVIFKSGDGGVLVDTDDSEKDTIIYDVLEGLTLKEAKDQGFNIPQIKAKEGYTVKEQPNNWQPIFNLDEDHVIKDGTYTAQYNKYDDIIDVSEKTVEEQNNPPAGFVKVTFKAGPGVDLEETKVYHVKKSTVLPDHLFPKTKVKTGYKGPVTWEGADQAIDSNTEFTAKANKGEDIIPVDPTDPVGRPEGYIKVLFTADPGARLGEPTVYFVNPEAADLSLGSLTKPSVTMETGYANKGWSVEDSESLSERTTDITVNLNTAEYPAIIAANENGQTNSKPDGYKTVTFAIKDEDNDKGSIAEDTNQVFYVHPAKPVELAGHAPQVKAKTNYAHDGWDRDISTARVFGEDTTIYATFNYLEDVRATTAEGYAPVEFIIEKPEGGKIADGQTNPVYILQGKEGISVTPPKVIANTGYSFEAKAGYEYDGWDTDFNNLTANTADTIKIKGSFTKLDDISDTAYPGYVEVTIAPGEDGTITNGKTKAYVNPHANKTVQDVLNFTGTQVTPAIGKSFDGWDKANDVEITSGQTITATYGDLDPISTSQHSGYVKVDFFVDTGDANKGAIPATETTTYYVNPSVPVTLTDKAPSVSTKTGFDHTGWDIDIDRRQIYFEDMTIKATFAAKDDYYTVDTPGYVKVAFALDDDSKGSLEGETVFWVNPNKTVTLPAPSVNENTGYRFDNWDTNFTDQKFTGKTTIKGFFRDLDDISPVQYPGYVKVTFDKGDHGKTIEGTTVYYVNPNKQVDLTNVADQIKITPEIGFNHTSWDNLTGPFTGETTIKANYDLIADVIPVTDPATTEKPAGYKELKFSPGQGGLLDGTSLYYVNPTKNITLDHEDIKVPEPKPEEGYTFDDWFEPLDNDEVIDKDKHFWANFVLSEYRVTYTSTDDSTNIPVDSKTYKAGDKARVASGPDRSGYTFKGWSDGTKTYQPGDEIEVQKDGITLTALWEEIDIVDGDEEKPSEEFVTVTFTGGDHGQVTSTGPGFSGDGKDRVFKVHVRKNKVVDLSDLADAITIKADLGYGFDGWNPRTSMGAFNLASLSINTDLTIDAQYETLPDTIAVDDPANPPTKPEGYVEVVFTGGQGSNLQGSQTYYVNPSKNITAASLAPSVTMDTGYENQGWYIGDSPLAADQVVDSTMNITLKTEPIADYIEAKPGVNMPEGYVTVTFEPGPNGSWDDGATSKTYYVNPKKAVKLPVDDPTPNTGYSFAGWSEEVREQRIYEEDLTIQGRYNELDAVLDNPVDGYIKVDFAIIGQGGSIVAGETTTYYVNPNAEVVIPTPQTKAETGYDPVKWNPNPTEPRTYTEDTTITGEFTKLDDISDTAYPGYVEVTISAGDKGTITSGKTKVYVNPNAGKSAADVLAFADPSVSPKTGYRFKGWDKGVTDPVTGNLTINAVYEDIPAVIPVTDSSVGRPTGYVEVKFTAGSGGTLDGNSIFYVNPEANVKLGDINVPQAMADSGYKFVGWLEAFIENEIVTGDKHFVAHFQSDQSSIVITPDPGARPDPGTDPTRPRPVRPDPSPGIVRPKPRPGSLDSYLDDLISLPSKLGPKRDEKKEIKVHKAYMEGYPDGSIKPEGNMTRAEAAAVVIRLEGLEADDLSPTIYSDVDNNGWYVGYLNTAVEKGMLLADGDKLRPNDPITRGELANMISVIDKDSKAKAKFTDIAGHKFEDEINKIYGNKRIEGYEDGTFRPDRNITRAEVATILNRMYDRYVDREGLGELSKEVTRFKDLYGARWYYYELIEATNSHKFYRNGDITKDNRQEENWTEIIR